MPRKRTIALVVVLALGAFVVVLNWTWGDLPPEPEPTGTFAELDGRRIHLQEQAGEGTPVVLLHGLPGTAADFDAVLERLPGRHTIAIDRPGYGHSDGGYHPLDEQLATIEALLDARGIDRAILVGHSYGGALALAFAARHPERVERLVLAAAAAAGQESSTAEALQARLVQTLSLPVVQPLADATFSQAMRTVSAKQGAKEAFDPDPVDPAYEDRLLRVTMQHDDLDALAGEQLAAGDVIDGLQAEDLARIDVPAVVIQGREDRLVPEGVGREIAAALPRSKLELVPGGHMVPSVHPEEVVAGITCTGQCGTH